MGLCAMLREAPRRHINAFVSTPRASPILRALEFTTPETHSSALRTHFLKVVIATIRNRPSFLYHTAPDVAALHGATRKNALITVAACSPTLHVLTGNDVDQRSPSNIPAAVGTTGTEADLFHLRRVDPLQPDLGIADMDGIAIGDRGTAFQGATVRLENEARSTSQSQRDDEGLNAARAGAAAASSHDRRSETPA